MTPESIQHDKFPGSVTVASVATCMNHLSPVQGGLMSRGAISILMLNLSTFSHTDLSHVLVIHFP